MRLSGMVDYNVIAENKLAGHFDTGDSGSDDNIGGCSSSRLDSRSRVDSVGLTADDCYAGGDEAPEQAVGTGSIAAQKSHHNLESDADGPATNMGKSFELTDCHQLPERSDCGQKFLVQGQCPDGFE